MKKYIILIFLFLIFNQVNAQVGFSLAYSTNNVLSFDFFYRKYDNRYHIGYGYQYNGQKHTVVKERKSNYGLTFIESA